MPRLIDSIWTNLFVRNVAILISGTAISQAVVLLSSPILSRIYDPTAFGILAVVLAVGEPCIEIASLKYDVAIVQAKEDKGAANLLVLSAGLVILFALIMTIVVIMARDWIAEQMGDPAAADLLFFSPAFVLCVGLYNVMASWLNRKRSYRSISVSEICRSVFMVVLQIALGLVENATKGLAFGKLTGRIIGLAYLCQQIGRQDWSFVRKSIQFDSIKYLAREHSQFPKYGVPREFLISVSSSATPILIAMFFSPASAGLYWFAMRILEAPKTLIGKAVRRVFFQRAVILHHDNENILPLLIKTTASLAGLALIPTAVIVFFGPDLFDVVFGSQWRGAGVYAQWLILWWMSSFCASGAMTLVSILNIQRDTLLIEIAGFGLRLAALITGVALSSDILAVALYSISGFLTNTARLVYIFHHALKPSTVHYSTEFHAG